MPSTLKCNKISPNTIYNNLTHSVPLPPDYPMANSIKQIHNLNEKLNNSDFFDPSIVPTFDAELLDAHDPETVKNAKLNMYV